MIGWIAALVWSFVENEEIIVSSDKARYVHERWILAEDETPVVPNRVVRWKGGYGRYDSV